jgi:hypothetical protein
MKITTLFLIVAVIFAADASAYADMSQVASRAADLGMTTQDYVFSMSIAGTLTGFLFGLFLWKLS